MDLFLGPLGDLHGLSNLEHPNDVGVRGNCLLKLCFLHNGIMGLARGGVGSPGVTFHRDPSYLVIVEGPGLHPGHPRFLLNHRALHYGHDFTDLELLNYLAILDVEVVCDRNRRHTGVELALPFGKNGALLIPDAEPAGGFVRQGLAFCAESRREGLLLGTFQHFHDLAALQHANRFALAHFEAGAQRHLICPEDGVEWLLRLLEENGSLVALDAQPSLR
mmetsp:Transcript_2794/g.6322  ORF Transcript_2794/g.6322 Transcript_2794/m.6322 type:complete len:220 (-) Transcript_2794:2140-2799(-)